MPKLKYSRILLKLSGEALGGKSGIGLDPAMFNMVAKEIKTLHKLGVQIALVIGGGNIFRGATDAGFDISRSFGDLIGMEATVINSMLMKDVLIQSGVPAHALSALGKTTAMEQYTIVQALSFLNKNHVVLCAGGSGNPYFSTDSAAVLRGLELECEVVLKATKVDGVYTDDPMKNKKAKKYETLTYQTAIEKNLKVMDQTAFVLAKEHHISIIVFDLFRKDALRAIVTGQKVGTLVS